MIVTSEHVNALTTLPVPYTYGLIVRTAQDPWIFVMEYGRTNVIYVSEKCEDALPLNVVPNFDFVIVASGYENRLLIVKANTSNGSVVFFEFFEQSTHTVVP
jgi:hypothetical protein